MRTVIQSVTDVNVLSADVPRRNDCPDSFFTALQGCRGDGHSVETVLQILDIDLPGLTIPGTMLSRGADQQQMDDCAQLQATARALSTLRRARLRWASTQQVRCTKSFLTDSI